MMAANRVNFAFTDEETSYPEGELAAVCRTTSKELLDRSPYSYDITHYRPFKVRVELDGTPRVSAGDERQVTLTFVCNPKLGESRKLQIRLMLPDTWSVGKYDKTLTLPYPQPIHGIFGVEKISFTVTAGERVDAVNRVYAEVTCPTLPYPVTVPIVFIG
jgi:hypothetical protein